MGESRDANDPRDAMRGLSKETEAEFERAEAGQTGGQEHASRADREGIPAVHRREEQDDEEAARGTAGQPDAGDDGRSRP